MEKTFTFDNLRRRYEGMTARILVTCELTTDLIGGMPADREGVETFVKHHLKLEGDEAEAAVHRILGEELDTTPENGEITEKESFGVSVLRKSENGVYLKDHMFKAMLKVSASRLGLYTSKKGSKGDMAEMGEVHAAGGSLIDHPWRVYLRSPDWSAPAATHFQQFRGRVNTPKGAMSIVSDCETVPAGSMFCWEYRYLPTKISVDDIANIISASMVVGLGSAKAFECGKFKVHEMKLVTPEKD